MQSLSSRRLAPSQAGTRHSDPCCSGRQLQASYRPQPVSWRSVYGPHCPLVALRATTNSTEVAVSSKHVATSPAPSSVVGSAPSPPQTDLEAQVQQAWQAGYQAGLLQGKASREPVNETLGRSALKGLTWRIVSTATTIVLALTVLKGVELDQALEMGAAEFVSKYIIFFIHERLWVLIPFSVLP